MGTRGVFGFHIDEIDKITYNHYDSYPECLGSNIVKDINKEISSRRNPCREVTGYNVLTEVELFADLVRDAKKLKLVKGGDSPTEEQRKELGLYDVFGEVSWDNVLRNYDGDIYGILETGYMVDSYRFVNLALVSYLSRPFSKAYQVLYCQ